MPHKEAKRVVMRSYMYNHNSKISLLALYIYCYMLLTLFLLCSFTLWKNGTKQKNKNLLGPKKSAHLTDINC